MTRHDGLVYVVESFPAYSQTFIQNEIRALQAHGVEPTVFSLYPLHDPEDPSVDDIPHGLLASPSRSPGRTIQALLRAAGRHPIGLARAVGLVATRPSRLQLHALGKALLLVEALGPAPVRRIHAHFARASASTAMLAATITGARFSFTAHAVDIFWQPFDVDRKLRRADVSVTVCEYNRRFMAEHWPDLGQVVVIPCGIDPSVFTRHEPYRATPFTVVAVGRLVEKKGFADLIRACRIARDRGVELRCRIVGDGEEREQLACLIVELDLADTVVLVGGRSPSEVRDELDGASVFCLPCRVDRFGNRDSQPVVVKEAMAMEVPIVGTTEVAMPEMVDDEVGVLVPPGDAEALADALVELAQLGASDLAQLGRRGRARVLQRFAIADCAAALLAAFDAAEQRRG